MMFFIGQVAVGILAALLLYLIDSPSKAEEVEG